MLFGYYAVRIIAVLTILFLLADLFVDIFYGSSATISDETVSLSKKYPQIKTIIIVACVALLIHLFGGVCVPN